MMFSIAEARDILRLDDYGENDAVISPLVQAITPYIAVTTGYDASKVNRTEISPIAKAIGQFLLKLWYFGEDVDKLQRAIDCLSKALAAEQTKNENNCEV